jgi:glycosyltransferase involved in cell wall biosynthesis
MIPLDHGRDRPPLRFSIIVPVYNTAPFLLDCITALKGQDYDPNNYEIIMVENNSTDGSAEFLAGVAGIRLLSEAKQGAYAARNRGLLAARGDILAFTDSDCMPDARWLQSIARRFTDPRIHVLLGSRRPRDDEGRLRLLCNYEDAKAALMIGVSSAEAQYGYTNNMAVRRSTLEKYGPFVESLRGGDTVLVRTIVNGEGVTCATYEPMMKVIHAELASVGSYWRKVFLYGRSFHRYSQRVKAQPLTIRERLQAFRATTSAEGHTIWNTAVLVMLLLGGMACWRLGRIVAMCEP